MTWMYLARWLSDKRDQPTFAHGDSAIRPDAPRVPHAPKPVGWLVWTILIALGAFAVYLVVRMLHWFWVTPLPLPWD